jgi:hypothetical protein
MGWVMLSPGDLHFYMRHSFKPAPPPQPKTSTLHHAASSPDLNDLSSHNPFAETAPAKVLAAKVAAAAAALSVGKMGGSMSSVASSDNMEPPMRPLPL